ncbi:MAG: segregation/condensation protein A [Bdellovibrionales bacterium]|nr:segregation/condensation protein A [Bdellovibrionales bacterium]
MSLVIHLERFEGPLALLLHLIRREEMDIFDINIHQITSQYLEFIKAMKNLDLENAGEFVAMAATLIQIKSKLLLPQYNESGEVDQDEDPRKELVSKLFEYQKYQDAAHRLNERPLVGRDLFLRGERLDLGSPDVGEILVEENALFALISSYRSTVRNMKKGVHFVAEALLSISERILQIKDVLIIGKIVGFFDLIDAQEKKRSNQILVTFISLLELAKMGFISLFQADDQAEIRIQAKNAVDRDVIARVEDYDNAHSAEVAEQLLVEAQQGISIDPEEGADKLMADRPSSESPEAEISVEDGATDEEILEEEKKLIEEDFQKDQMR